jgi:hypothetical protein
MTGSRERTRTRRYGPVVAAGLVGALGLAACGGEGTPVGSGGSGGTTGASSPSNAQTKQTTAGAQATSWNLSRGTPAFAPGAVVVFNPTENQADPGAGHLPGPAVAAYNQVNGNRLWAESVVSLQQGVNLYPVIEYNPAPTPAQAPVIVPAGGGWAVPVTTVQDVNSNGLQQGSQTIGVALLAGTSGKLLWDQALSRNYVPVAGNSSVILVSPSSGQSTTTTALATSDGHVLWTDHNFAVSSIEGQLGIGTTSQSYPAAVNLSNGQLAWTAQGVKGGVAATTSSVVAVDGYNVEYILNLATGATITSFPSGVDDACVTDQHSVLICGPPPCSFTCSYDSPVVAVNPISGSQLWSIPATTIAAANFTLLGTANGFVYGSTADSGNVALDASTGKQVATEVGYAPSLTQGNLAIDTSVEGPSGFAVFRLGNKPN